MRLPECIFTEAFIYENNLNDYGKASYYYNLFLMKYPNHPLAESASAGIKNLGKPLDQLIHEFEAKREETQAKK